jgi:hypothetical protein
MGRQIIVTEKDRIIAAEILKGVPIYQGLVGNGYSEKVARQGNAKVSKAIKLAMLEMGQRDDWMGEQLLANPKLIENTVVGWLYRAMQDGRSRGVTAAKLLGQHRKVDMFASDQQNNVMVIQAPSDWKAPDVTYAPQEQQPALPPGEADTPDYE